MSTIVILAGGTSSERAVSLRSGEAVANALRSKGHTVTLHDPSNGIDNLGSPDVVFPALHGAGGEDGTIQAELEKYGHAYVGSDVTSSALCFDKWAYKQKLTESGLPTARAEMVTQVTFWESQLSKRPFVLKPVTGGSSIDTFIIRDVNSVDKQRINESLGRYDEMLLEELIEGAELTAGVLDTQALPIIEIIPPAEGEFDYENKYNGKTQELCPPKNISEAVQKQAQGLALQAHTLMGCRDLSRTDMIVTSEQKLVILETNTLPGMTDQSLFPKAAAASGIPMAELVDRLVQMALART